MKKLFFLGFTIFFIYCCDPNEDQSPYHDRDNDDIQDDIDNCPDTPNYTQVDRDGDGTGDACDDDMDNDGVLNDDDNCRVDPNAGQENMDGDDFGDACDYDIDGDGVNNNDDNCPTTPNAGQEDMDYDGIGDLCDNDFLTDCGNELYEIAVQYFMNEFSISICDNIVEFPIYTTTHGGNQNVPLVPVISDHFSTPNSYFSFPINLTQEDLNKVKERELADTVQYPTYVPPGYKSFTQPNDLTPGEYLILGWILYNIVAPIGNSTTYFELLFDRDGNSSNNATASTDNPWCYTDQMDTHIIIKRDPSGTWSYVVYDLQNGAFNLIQAQVLVAGFNNVLLFMLHVDGFLLSRILYWRALTMYWSPSIFTAWRHPHYNERAVTSY